MSRSPLEDRRKRIIFWECYSLDRLSSAVLGRPFGIDDEDIEVDLPLPGDAAAVSLSFRSQERNNPTQYDRRNTQDSDLRVFTHLLKLSRVSSGINDSLPLKHASPYTCQSRNRNEFCNRYWSPICSPSPVEVYAHVVTLHGQLHNWREDAPSYTEPRCVYKSSEFFDLCYQKERLFLLREAIDRVVSPGLLPPDALLGPCVDAASTVIRLFAKLRNNSSYITYTRTYAHLIFLCGMILLFAAFVQLYPAEFTNVPWSDVEKTSQMDGFAVEYATIAVTELVELLISAKESLERLSDNMPDLAVYPQFIDAFRSKLPVHGSQHGAANCPSASQKPNNTANSTSAHEPEGAFSSSFVSDSQQTVESTAPDAVGLGHADVTVQSYSCQNPTEFERIRPPQQEEEEEEQQQQPITVFQETTTDWFSGDHTGAEFPPANSSQPWPFSYIPWTEQWELDFTNYDWLPPYS